MKTPTLLVLLLILGSCANATMTKNPNGKHDKYAPKNYQGVGQVKYLNQGADSIIDGRREDAFKQMYMACNGEYEIVKETGTNNSVTFTGNTAYASDNYIYLDFKCTGPRSAASDTPKEKNCGLIGKIFGC